MAPVDEQPPAPEAPVAPADPGAPEPAIIAAAPPPRRGGGAALGPKPNGAMGFRNEWATSMMEAPMKHTGFCCLSCFCPWCCAFQQRRKLLEGKMENYVCCAGIFPCMSMCKSCVDMCPSVCLCIEAVWCLGCAAHGNRWMIQQRYQLENECCDLFLMWVSCLCGCLACLTGQDSLEFAADVLFYVTIGCMLAQHDLELKQRGFPNEGPKAEQMT